MNEFQKVPPCGGKITITVVTDSDGKKKYSIELRHVRPTKAAWFAVYALPQGIPVKTFQLGGMGQNSPPPPYPDCFSVFIAADETGFLPIFVRFAKTLGDRRVRPLCGFQHVHIAA